MNKALLSNLSISVCSLCRDLNTSLSIESQIRQLFPINSQILIIENSTNQWDCYSAIRYFTSQASGDFIVILHDDICFGKLSVFQLMERIYEVLDQSPTAALFGIAGITKYSQKGVGHFWDNMGEQVWGFEENGLVSSLDEFFLVLRNRCGINVSYALKGYHFYGTDLCMNAMKLGFSSHVIDYPLIHKSKGTLNEAFFQARELFQKHLIRQKIFGFIKTTCTVLYAGESGFMECWALALSYVLIESSSHRDLVEATQSIMIRGSDRYGRVIFLLMIMACRALNVVDRMCVHINWWMKNWRVRLFAERNLVQR